MHILRWETRAMQSSMFIYLIVRYDLILDIFFYKSAFTKCDIKNIAFEIVKINLIFEKRLIIWLPEIILQNSIYSIL